MLNLLFCIFFGGKWGVGKKVKIIQTFLTNVIFGLFNLKQLYKIKMDITYTNSYVFQMVL